jgi:hypothetical protein
LLLLSAEQAVAVESKLTEFLVGRQRAAFSPRYAAAVAELAHPTWGAEYRRLIDEPERFQFLNAAQLVKHYLGLKRSLARLGRSHGTLLYLFWEPSDAADWPPFARHREEIAIFSEQLADPEVALEP